MKKDTIHNTLPGLTYIHGHLEHVFSNTSASVYWKDRDSKYLGINDLFLKRADLTSFNDIIGNTDRDLCWGEQEALLMQHNDKNIILSGNPNTYVEPGKCYKDKKIRYFLSYKKPLLSHTGKVIGVFGVSYILDGSQTTSRDIKNAGFSDDFVLLNNLQSQSDDTNYNLTSRQIDCLYYLAKGFSIKQIGKALQLSPRTVEHHFEAIKSKLNCETRVELTEKAFKIKAIRYRLLQSLGNNS